MKIRRIVLGTLIALFLIIVVCYIGIPSRLFSDSIDTASLQRIKRADSVLVLAQSKARHETGVGLEQFLPEYGNITDADQVKELFSFLSNDDKDKIIALFDKKDIKEIDMHGQGCIRYTIKTSLNNYLINSSAQTLYLYHDVLCVCACQGIDHDSDDKVKEWSMGNHWFKVRFTYMRKPFHG